MPTSSMSTVIHHLRKTICLHERDLTDAQLLEQFIANRDEAAFAALVRRHGSMVMGVCLRVVRNHQDAEDAFQATFLVLVRKAASIASRGLLANWLYGVAYNTALKAKASNVKRQAKEKQVTEMPDSPVIEQELWSDDLQRLLDQELSRLPEKYRVPIILCDIEGKTRKDAALQLGCPEGSLSSRLSRARVMLAKRLARHGLAVSGGSLAAALSQNASASVPMSLVTSTIKVATLYAAGQTAGVVSAKVAALTQGALKTMLLSKLKIGTMWLLISLIAVGGGFLIYQSAMANAGSPIAHATTAKLPNATAFSILIQQAKGAKADALKQDLKKLNGIWVVVSTEIEGKMQLVADDESYWEFDGVKLTSRLKGEVSTSGLVRLDPTKNPKAIDIDFTTPEGTTGTLVGIYQFRNDGTLWLAFDGSPSVGRPAEFSTKPGSGHRLLTLKVAHRSK